MAKTESLALPTRPEGTDVKKGLPPSMLALASCAAAGCRKASASLPVANCGMRVSNLVLTTTDRESVGSTCAAAHKRDTSNFTYLAVAR